MKIISFPRSGQHLIERFLNFYHKQNNIKYSYCEYYNHCLKIPCTEHRIYQKNHDWNLDLQIKKDEKCIVLYRSNIQQQLDSFYIHNTKKSKLIYKSEIDEYTSFIKNKKIFYEGFVKKWIENSNENILKIDYEKLIKNPELNFSLIISHIFKNPNKNSVLGFFEIEKIKNNSKKVKIIKLFN